MKKVFFFIVFSLSLFSKTEEIIIIEEIKKMFLMDDGILPEVKTWKNL